VGHTGRTVRWDHLREAWLPACFRSQDTVDGGAPRRPVRAVRRCHGRPRDVGGGMGAWSWGVRVQCGELAEADDGGVVGNHDDSPDGLPGRDRVLFDGRQRPHGWVRM
jgi:hypothetical protein